MSSLKCEISEATNRVLPRENSRQLFFRSIPLGIWTALLQFLLGYEASHATSRACVRINLRKETKMEYLSRGFKSVLGNQQGGSQPSPHETVRICANAYSLQRVTVSDVYFRPQYWSRLKDYVTGWPLLRCWKTDGMLCGRSSRSLRLVLIKLKTPYQRIFLENFNYYRSNAIKEKFS